MKRFDLTILWITTALVVLPFLTHCGSDKGFSGSGFQNTFNPNPGPTPPPNPNTTCQLTYALDATLETTFSKGPNHNEVDHTFYFEATSQTLTLLSSTCPFTVENFYGDFEFAVGRYIGPPLPLPVAPVKALSAFQELTATSAGLPGEVDLFGLFVNTALFQGTATTIDSTHLSFTILYPDAPYWSHPDCLVSFNLTDGDLQIEAVSSKPIVTLSAVGVPTLDQYHLSATVPIVIKHASNITSCNGVFPDEIP